MKLQEINKKKAINIASISAAIIFVAIYLIINKDKFVAGIIDGIRDLL